MEQYEFTLSKPLSEPLSEHQGLWWRVMMRSETCMKNVPQDEGAEEGA